MDLWQLDATGMRAHPARETRREAGLLLQATGGYTQRANSAVPMAASVPDACAAVAAATRFYAKRDLPATFRLPTFVDDAPLRAALDEGGFEQVSPTRVMAMALGGAASGAATRGGVVAVMEDVGAWCRLHDRLSGSTPDRRRPSCRSPQPAAPARSRTKEVTGTPVGGNACRDFHRSDFSRDGGAQRRDERLELIQRIAPACLMVRLDVEDQAVGAGIVVIDDGYTGLYSLVIAPAQRGHGFGTALLQQLLATAAAHGATHAYLQVAADNPACRLYERLGFIERYAYTYFVKTSRRGQTPF